MSPCATVFRNKNKKIYFENFFSGYSYLEDLDYSYRINKFAKLIVVKNSKCYHYNNIERKSFNFGKKEFINRHYFVKKIKLNKINFFLGMFVKLFLNLIKFKMLRVLGNIF